MNSLTADQVKALNNTVFEHYPSVPLGTYLQQLITELPVAGTPVNAVNATKTLTLTGVVVHGETVTIHNPAIAWDNVYEFLADAAQSKSDPMNVAVDIEANTTKSTINLTVPTQPTSGDTMTIGTKVFTFVPVGTANADGEVSVGTDLATAQAAILAAINGTDDHNEPHPLVSAGEFAANVSAITALVGGTVGDAIATTETFTAVGNVFSGVTLAGGADCSAANAITALVAAVTLFGNQGVAAADGAGDTVVFTAEVAGVAGNLIEIGETLANGSFEGGAVLLSGGVNGTVGFIREIRIDTTYLYVCTAANTVSGKNWRRIALGAAY